MSSISSSNLYGNLANSYNINYPKLKPHEKNQQVSFGRALSTRELNEVFSLAEYSRQNILKIKNIGMILFSSSCPSEIGKNPGLGTINSKSSIEMVKSLRKLTTMDAIQLGPHGIVPGCTLSPYSGSSFALNHRNIDLIQLTEDSFGNILKKTSNHLKSLFDNNDFEKYNINLVNKDHVDNLFDPVLEEAFSGFKKLDNSHCLKHEYNNFLRENDSKWLHKDSLYQAFSLDNTEGQYINDYWPNWQKEIDKNIFGYKQGSDEAKVRISEIESKYAEEINFHKFKQFIAQKQLLNAKSELNNSGIKVLGDCPISFSPRDQWANLNDFETDRFIGARNLDGSIQFWGGPLWKNADIVEKRFDRMNELYDGLRADAGWEYKRSVIYTADRQHVWDGDQGRDVLDRFNASSRKYGKDLSLNSIENTFGSCNVQGQLNQLNREGFPIPEIVITAHGDFAEHQAVSTWAAATTHDTPSLLEYTNGDTNKATDWFAGIMKGPKNNRGSENVLLNFTDVFGKSEKVNGNIDGAQDWKERLPNNWEEFIHKQLKNGYGFNLPEVIKRAICYKVPEYERNGVIWDIIGKLDNYSRILREDGPMTTKEADKVIDFINV